MKNHHPRTLEALRLLVAAPLSYQELAARLYISLTYAKQVVRRLRHAEFSVRGEWRGKVRVFQATATAGGLAALLNEEERLALNNLYQQPPSPLQNAFHKLSNQLLLTTYNT